MRTEQPEPGQPSAWDNLRWPLIIVLLLGGHFMLMILCMCFALNDPAAIARPPAPLSGALEGQR